MQPTVGVIGGSRFVRHVSDIARTREAGNVRLVAGEYADESDAAAQAARIQAECDALLFAGPLPYDVAAREVQVPATFVPAGGPALFATLMKGALATGVDLGHISVDTISSQELAAAFDEIDVDHGRSRTFEYDGPGAAARFLDFHRRELATGASTMAITTVPTVHATLAEENAPTLLMTPLTATVHESLRTAMLLATGARTARARIATILVRMPASTAGRSLGSSAYAAQARRLAMHRSLLDAARSLDASLVQRDERTFQIICTLGSIQTPAGAVSVTALAEQVESDLGMPVEIGVGLGATALEAENNAEAAVELTATETGGSAYLLDIDGDTQQLDTRSEVAHATPSVDERSRDILDRLRARLDERGDSSRVVDAATVAQLMDVSVRTSRTMLQHLVDTGLAWPIASAPSGTAGRPPQMYHLLF